jgi:hypothetical protein
VRLARFQPANVSATQITLAVPVAIEPPEVLAESVGVGVVPSASEALPPSRICSSASITWLSRLSEAVA